MLSRRTARISTNLHLQQHRPLPLHMSVAWYPSLFQQTLCKQYKFCSINLNPSNKNYAQWLFHHISNQSKKFYFNSTGVNQLDGNQLTSLENTIESPKPGQQIISLLQEAQLFYDNNARNMYPFSGKYPWVIGTNAKQEIESINYVLTEKDALQTEPFHILLNLPSMITYHADHQIFEQCKPDYGYGKINFPSHIHKGMNLFFLSFVIDNLSTKITSFVP
eukprot:556406_1